MKSRNYLLPITLFIPVLTSMVFSKDINLTFNVGYISGSPDGVTVDHILTVNGQFPGMEIRGKVGDTLNVRVENNIVDTAGETPGTTIHWHGLFFRNGFAVYDGPAGVTQCRIAYNYSMDYSFPLEQSGTYWWHAHSLFQYTEGLLGPLIIEDDADPYLINNEYNDDSLVFTLSDWYHNPPKDLLTSYLAPVGTSSFPIPNSALINGHGSLLCENITLPCIQQEPLVYEVTPGTKYRIRIINVSTFWRFKFFIEGHKLEVIEVDGVLTKRVPCDFVVLAAAQRYSVIVTMNAASSSTNQDFFIRGTNTDNALTGIFSSSAILRYTEPYIDNEIPTPGPPEMDMMQNELLELDERSLIPYDDSLIPPESFDQNIVLELKSTIVDNIGYLTFNDIVHSIEGPPILYRMLNGETIPDSANPLHIANGNIIQVEIYNSLRNEHPFHLHGHNFWVVAKGPTQSGRTIAPYFYPQPILRDTVSVEGNATVVFRFKADNPGAWLFHCHINWHHIAGLAAVFIEGETEIKNQVVFPDFAKEICQQSNIDLSPPNID